MNWPMYMMFYQKDYNISILILISRVSYNDFLYRRDDRISRGFRWILIPSVIKWINPNLLSEASPVLERERDHQKRKPWLEKPSIIRGCKDMRTKRDRDSLSSCHRQRSKTYHAGTNAFHFSKRLELRKIRSLYFTSLKRIKRNSDRNWLQISRIFAYIYKSIINLKVLNIVCKFNIC